MVTPHLRPRFALGPRARRCLRRAVNAAAAVALVVMVRAVLGVWMAATLVALVGVAGLMAGWAAVEARAFGLQSRAADPVPVQRPELRGPDHVAFARGLAAVAAAYLAHCERQESGR